MRSDKIQHVLILTLGRVAVHRDPPIEISVGSSLQAVAFSANGDYFVSDADGVRVLRAEDAKQMTAMKARHVRCLAVSKNGKWIAAGTWEGTVFVWDAETSEQLFLHKDSLNNLNDGINGVDFSPDSTRLVSAALSGTVSVWDVTTGKRMQLLHHKDLVIAAKYSPQGDRIATATCDFVQVWDSDSGHSLVGIKLKVKPLFNTGVIWFNEYLFVISDREVMQIRTSTWSPEAISKWTVPASDIYSCIALPKHGGFIAYSTGRTVLLLETSTHNQLALIQRPQNIHSIVISPDDRFIAVAGTGENIFVKRLSRITVSIVFLDYASGADR